MERNEKVLQKGNPTEDVTKDVGCFQTVKGQQRRIYILGNEL